jgi:hypothetical protein
VTSPTLKQPMTMRLEANKTHTNRCCDYNGWNGHLAHSGHLNNYTCHHKAINAHQLDMMWFQAGALTTGGKQRSLITLLYCCATTFFMIAIITRRQSCEILAKRKKKRKHEITTKNQVSKKFSRARLIGKRRYKWPRTNRNKESVTGRRYKVTYSAPHFHTYICAWRPGADDQREGPIWIDLVRALREEKIGREAMLDGERLHPQPGPVMTSSVIDLEDDTCVDLITEGDPEDSSWSAPEGNGEFIIELTKVTSAYTRMVLLDHRKADATIMVEHSIPPSGLKKFYHHMKTAKRKCILFPVDKAAAKTNLEV